MRNDGPSARSAACLFMSTTRNEPSACSTSSILWLASKHRAEKRQARGDVVDPSRQAGAERSPDGHRWSLRGLHRTIEIVPPVKQFIGFDALVLGAFVFVAIVLVALGLVTLVLEAKHDLRVNTPAVVEVDRD